jgi:hypothetical protein
MNTVWQVTPDDVTKVRLLIDSYKDDVFVKERIRKNLQTEKPPVCKEDIWYWIVACLLTTQQRSGPGSAVTRFLNMQPFSLDYAICGSADDLGDLARRTLTDFGGIRRAITIGEELEKNLGWLEQNGWQPMLDAVGQLRRSDSRGIERSTAHFIEEKLAGFGPKQSRNLLQSLGLTRWEIPIDSRITKWLNALPFPVRLSAAALGERNYYEFVSDGLQELCQQAGVYPCVLDAAIFTSFDGGGWTEDILVW